MNSLHRAIVVAGYIILGALQASAQYSVTMPYKQVAVDNSNGIAAFSGADAAGMPGEPALPSYAVSFLLPPDADLSTVTASITNVTDKELSGTYIVNPKPPIKRADGTLVWPNGRIIVDGKDTAIYRNNAFFPADYLGTVSTEQPRAYRIAEIRIYPYLYNPVSNKLRMITGGTLNVRFSSGSTRSSVLRNDRMEKMLKAKIVNSSNLNFYGTAPAQSVTTNSATTFISRARSALAGKGSSKAAQASSAAVSAASAPLSGLGYLVIANSYTESAQGFDDYLTLLQQQGADLYWVDESYYNPAGNLKPQEIAANIRYTIQDWYSYCVANNIYAYYVLLIGNPDMACTDLPMINCGGTPTDFGYTDLSDNWKSEHIPWLAVGRIPVFYDKGGWLTDANSDINNGNLYKYLKKVMNYENATDVEWRRTLLACSSPFGWMPEGFSSDEDLKTRLAPYGWSCTRVYNPYSDIPQNERPYHLVSDMVNMNPLPEYIYGGAPAVVNAWNSETPGLVVWYTHGWSQGACNVISTAEVPNLSYSYPAMVFASSCNTSDPQDPKNLGVSLLWQNAVCYVGATTLSSNVDIAAKSFGVYVSQNYDAGTALGYAKWDDFNVADAQCYNLYGSPEVYLAIDQSAGGIGIPQNFVAHATTCGNPIQLTWNSVPGASAYYIERSENFSSKRAGFYTLDAVDGSATSYSDYYIDNCCGIYKYRIYTIDASWTHWSGYSAIDSAGADNCSSDNRVPNPPTGLSVASNGSNSVTLKWTGTSLATSYNIKRSTKSTDMPVTVANTSAMSFCDYNLVTNTTYYYYVSAVNSLGQSSNSPYLTVKATANPKAPTLNSVTNYSDQGTINPGAVCFQWTSNTPDKNDLDFEFVCARQFPDGTYSDSTYPITMASGPNVGRGSTQACSNLNIPLETNTDFGFMVRSASVCENSTDGSSIKVYSAFSGKYNFSTAQAPSPQITPPIPTSLTVTPGPEQLIVKWAFSGTTTDHWFEIYCTQPGVRWSVDPAVIPDYKARACTLFVARGKTYKVSMRAARPCPSYRLCSKFTSIVSATVAATGLAAPTNLAVSPSDNNSGRLTRGGLFLTWTDNSKAKTGYNIYRATSSSGPFTTKLASTTNSTYFANTGLPDGTKYYYQVKAYNGTETSAASNTASGTTIPNIAISKTASASTFQSGNTPAKGNDNSATTRWCASNSSVPQWWMVDLGSSKELAGSEIMWERAAVYKYIIETSDDKVSWTTVADLSGNTSTAQTQKQTFSSAYGQYIRVSVTGVATGNWASFFEFRVYGQ